MYPAFRSLLFQLDPERAHHLTLSLIRFVGAIPPLGAAVSAWFRPASLPVTAFGLAFVNPVGLAAGYDKDGLAWRGLATLGFGHIEIGTVTPLPQSGNPQPRLFRLPRDQALINRMGFPGRGADFVVRQLSRRSSASRSSSRTILGVNLGKNKDTPLESAAVDYVSLLKTFAPLADYLAINVSSPNTVGLRRLQGREYLEALLAELDSERKLYQVSLRKTIPLLVKLAPDLSNEELDDALEAIIRTGMDGVIATNTTLGRDGIQSPFADETGGLSGAPLRRLSTQMIAAIHARTGGKLPVIGVGGIQSAADAREKLDAGAVLVQVYTGLVYRGPGLVKEIVNGLGEN